MNLEEVLEHFDNPKKNGSGYMVRCPGHDDQKNSLSVTNGTDGRVLVKCHAGCATESVVEAAGLKMADLFSNGNGHAADPVIAQYLYCDEDGNPLFRVSRTASKRFFQERSENGQFIAGLKRETRRVPYNLPAVLKSTSILIVEGEKDVENLRSIGLTAATNAGGAEKWRDEFDLHFEGKRIVIIPDNDEPGRRHAVKVARSVLPVAEMVKIVHLPGVPDKGDVSDYLEKHSKEDLLALIKAANEVTAEDLEEDTSVERITGKPNEHKGESVIRSTESEPNEPQIVPFPNCAWQGVFSIWREIVCPTTESPEEYLWGACLSTLGLALGRNVKIQNPRTLHPNFYQLFLGQTGDDRKSTALDYAEKALSAIGILDEIDVLYGIQSSETVYDSLARMDGARSLIYADEFRSLLSVARRRGAEDIIPRLGSLYYCPPRSTLNRHAKESTEITNPFLSLIGATPVEYIQDLLSNLEVDGVS